MAVFFLIVIYITFISLGLPDSLLGSAWTVIHSDIGADIGAAGILTMIISGGTILSSLFSERLMRRFNTGLITAVSVLATAVALLGFSLSPSFLWLAAMSVPLGLGAGAVDAALNNYVATHYKPHHMSWLHCFWGIGAMCGPLIMAAFIARDHNWRGGYLTISIIQFALVVLLFLSLPLWYGQGRRDRTLPAEAGGEAEASDSPEGQAVTKRSSVFAVRGVPFALVSCFFYCGVELTASIWGSTFLVGVRGLEPAQAARWLSLYYGGITVGRFLTGFATLAISSKQLIRIGQIMILAGGGLLLAPGSAYFSLAGLILVGLGCAPVYPCILHETPHRFGVSNSQRIMGLQMACAYTGSTLLPPILGLLASKGPGIGVYPVLLLLYGLGLLLSSEWLNRMRLSPPTD